MILQKTGCGREKVQRNKPFVNARSTLAEVPAPPAVSGYTTNFNNQISCMKVFFSQNETEKIPARDVAGNPVTKAYCQRSRQRQAPPVTSESNATSDREDGQRTCGPAHGCASHDGPAQNPEPVSQQNIPRDLVCEGRLNPCLLTSNLSCKTIFARTILLNGFRRRAHQRPSSCRGRSENLKKEPCLPLCGDGLHSDRVHDNRL